MLNRPPENQSPIQGSKYSLVVAVAKRARQIVNRRDPGVVLPHKPVTLALQEIEVGAVRVVGREAGEEPEVSVAGEAQLPDTRDESSEEPQE